MLAECRISWRCIVPWTTLQWWLTVNLSIGCTQRTAWSQLSCTCPGVYLITMGWMNAIEMISSLDCVVHRIVSQLYGSTTVVMSIYGLHWKWRILTPYQRRPSEPIEKIFGMIDYVIDLNNLAKFGFGRIFRDWGTYTQHIRVCAFFSFFFF